ncbi:unnamed protein product [Peniophora sp. CBMAI 1063]|nr:unnamed protein product [Peniophora sp. CBMAI 1063]
MDRLIPSPHNSMTVAAPVFMLVLSMANLFPNDAKIWLPLTREGNYTQVCLGAFDSLSFTKWYTSKIVRYVLAVIACDSSRVARRQVARKAGRSLALFVAVGESRGGGSKGDESRPTLIEENSTGQPADEKREKGEVDVLIKALRKDDKIGKGEALREIFLPLALDPNTDAEVRWSVLVKGSEEAPSKFTVASAAIPTVKVPVKKAGTPVLPSIKLKLPTMPQKPVEPAPTSPSVLPSVPVVRLPAPRVEFSKSQPVSLVPAPAPVLKKPRALPPPAPPASVVLPSNSRPPMSSPKTQSDGIGIVDLKATSSVLQKFTQHKAATLFSASPSTHRALSQPIPIRGRLQAQALMVRTAKEASKLEGYFEAQWSRMSKTIEKAQPVVHAMAQRVMPPPPVLMPIEAPEEASRPPVAAPVPAPASKLRGRPPDNSTSDAGVPRLKLKIGGVGTQIAGP